MKKRSFLALGLCCVSLLVCTRKPGEDERLSARLMQHVGVWEGTYTYTTPSGVLTDQHASRNESWIEGGTWRQRLVYRWADGRERHLAFTAHIRGGRLVYDDPAFDGVLFPVSDDVAMYLGTSTSPPSLRIIETIVTVGPDHQTRSWQVMEDGVWTQAVAIDEHRVEQR